MKKTKLPKISLKPLLLALLIFIAAEIFLLGTNNYSKGKLVQQLPSQSNSQLKKYADEILKKCESENSRPTCYDKEIPKLMDYITMEDAFKVTSLIQDQDKGYPYCHVLGHKLSAREIDKDPSKWKDVVSRCPSGMCSNGCIHGGFQERFRAESFTDEQIQHIKPDLIDLCEKRANWQPTGLEQASCYHALGHLTMYLTSADINKATSLCEEVAIKEDGRNFAHLCFDGAYMQIYQPLEPEDFALIKGKEVKKDQMLSFCNQFIGQRRASCISESWPLFSEDIKKPEGLVKFCLQEETSAQDRCFAGLLYVLTAQFRFDSQKIQDLCLGLPTNRQGRCFADAASRMIETDYRNVDKAVELCSNSQTDSNKDTCFAELLKYSTYNFHVGSDAFFKLCHGLPDPWQTKCLVRK